MASRQRLSAGIEALKLGVFGALTKQLSASRVLHCSLMTSAAMAQAASLHMTNCAAVHHSFALDPRRVYTCASLCAGAGAGT